MAELANRQHGVVSLTQLEAIGINGSAVRGWVARGRLQRIHREVFAVGHRALRREGHWMAAVLACGPGAVLSHGSAAALWDLRRSDAVREDVTVRGRVGRSRPGLRVHCGDRMYSDEITSHRGIPCTTVDRTLLDLAAVVDLRGLERACEQAERIAVLDVATIDTLLARHSGRRGTARLRGLLLQWDPHLIRTRSELEVRFLRLCTRAGLPRPVVNGRIDVGARALEVDFHWPEARLVVETDGGAHRTSAAFERDRWRDQVLGVAGWRVIRCTWRQVADDPDRIATTIRQLLGASG